MEQLNSAIEKISIFSSFTKFAIGKGRTQSNLGMIKATLLIKGIISNDSLSSPLEALTDDEKANLKKALNEINII